MLIPGRDDCHSTKGVPRLFRKTIQGRRVVDQERFPECLIRHPIGNQIDDEHFSRQYGFWRPYVEQVIYRYLDCGDLHDSSARVKCKDCGHEYL